MKYRKLRIAFSAACGLVTLWLLVVADAGIDSPDYDWKRLSKRYGFETTSDLGHLTFRLVDTTGNVRPWSFSTVGEGRPVTLLVGDEPRPTFGIKRDGLTLVADMPSYAPIAAALTLAVLPWLPWRFSLRTLLISFTLLALSLGLIIWSTR
jgi:hypothetical protein